MAKINPEIFKAYDIRGIYPGQLNEEVIYKIGQALVDFLKAKAIIVGRDMRLSSPSLFKALTKGIINQGADVLDLGLVSPDCVYFASGKLNLPGIMISASHNPKEYNGLKVVKKGVNVIRGKEIAKIIKKFGFTKSKKNGAIKKIDIWPDYLSHIFSFAEINKIKSLKVVVDAGNGMAGKVIPLLEPKLPVEIIPLNFNLDGNFPVHSPNPLLKGVTDQLSREVKAKKADLGFIFDGDADRIFLIDEKGNFVRADITLLLLAKYFLEKNPGAGIAYNVICSKAVPEFIKKWGGKPIRTPVGFVNVKEGMIQNKGMLGGELSAHYSFKDNFYSDSGFIAFLILLQIISETGKKASEMVKELNLYTKTEEINFEIEDKEAILNKVKQQYSDGKQDYLDGLTVEYKDWWFNLRPSQTEPLLRLNLEAKTEKLMKQKKAELLKIIQAL
ncbi:MAG TPA: phosphomannomutase/phosphoglucomutase [Candidatus Portnoybacteria bacterium]|nr:phosphomannomutase/phosphoglucomutase [Candidatus Portnoybacteria bacterium]